MEILQDWERLYGMSRIPILAVGSEEDFDSWDLDGFCPTIWILDRDMSVRKVDINVLDLEDVEGWL